MDYKTQIENIINQFQNSFNFHILKNNYGYSSSAKDFLDTYKRIIENTLIDDKYKYERLLEHIKNNMNATLSTMPDIKKINSLWIPELDSIKNDDLLIQNRLRSRTNIVCNSIKNLFENPNIRKNLSNQELYFIYQSYNSIYSLTKNNQISEDILQQVENSLDSIVKMQWEKSITNPNEFVSGEPFMFIVHNISKTLMTNTTESITRKTRVSTSLITDKEMGLFGANKYGFIYPSTSKIITAGFDDLQSYEVDSNEIFNSRNSSLITPQEIESYSVDKCIEVNGQTLNSDNGNIYNEVLLDTEGLNPVGIFCVTYGEKELSYDYMSAKELAKNVGLPLIEIDISLYRTKDNQGTYLTDREPLTPREQSKFAENFLKQYYKSTSITDIETVQNFIESDLFLYQDIIVDIFLQAKRDGKEINKDNLFKQFSQLKNQKRDKLENFNKNSNESKKIVESIKNLQDAIKSTDNPEIKEKIENELNSLIQRLEELKKLMINENSLDLSPENWIYQSNNISNEIMQDYTPFVIEKITVGDKVIDAITGYKTKEQIEQEKEQMLEQVALSSDPTTERLEHAKRVIDVKCNGYITNATISNVNQYELSTPELDRVVENSRTFIDVAHLDREITNYDDIIAIRQELLNGINELGSNRKILDGSSTINGLEQLQRDSATKIDGLNTTIKTAEEQIRELRSQLTQLSFEKQQLEKGFISKIASSSKIQELEFKTKGINNEIEKLERTIELSKDEIKFEESFINGQISNFLSNFGLDGMTLADYKLKLRTIESNGYELTDLSKQKDMESRLAEIEKRISEMKINAQNEREKREQLLNQKQQLGITPNEDVKETQNMLEEEFVEEQTVGIKR